MTYPISQRQLMKLHTLFGDLGITDRAEKLRVVSACLYRPVTSTKTLTWNEASVALNTLTSITQVRDDQAGAIDRLIAVAERRMAAAS